MVECVRPEALATQQGRRIVSLKLRHYPELARFRHKREWKGALEHAKKVVRESGRYRITTGIAIVIALPLFFVAHPIMERYFAVKVTVYVLIPMLGSLAGLSFRKELRRSLRKQLANRGVAICVPCGYDLRGQAEPRCPECGVAFDLRLLQSPPEGPH
jgi:hypothetical protein